MESEQNNSFTLNHAAAQSLYVFLQSCEDRLDTEMLYILEKVRKYMFQHHSVKEIEQFVTKSNLTIRGE